MVNRIFVEKKPGFNIASKQLLAELRDILGIPSLQNVRIINRYDVEGLSPELLETATKTVFSEPQSDVTYASIDELLAGAGENGEGAANGSAVAAAGAPTADTPAPARLFAVEFLPGQFDQRAESASECIQLISQGDRPAVRSATVYVLEGALSDEEVAAIKSYVINPIESREADMAKIATLSQDFPEPPDVEILDGFNELDEAGLSQFIQDRGLAMDLADIVFLQKYFAETEQRNPTITEIKMVDTYWSDHCRHTTFGTEFTDIEIADANVADAFDTYLVIREELGREEKPVCLMDMGTIGAKALKASGELTGLDESEEINACTVRVKVDVNGEEQDWLYLFKNETHNHPTEIEPFGGAATCLGGAIRDPLSGRAYVYQAMRLTGAADPTVPVADTIQGKLPQRKLVTTAAQGYSSYGNQIGLATGQVHELYHPGYAAKHMEVGAVVGATPASDVVRETPAPGDVIVLLGGRTGRDGIGGATGSSKAHSATSIETCGAEVQKGNPPIERKIQRLFRNGEACRMIKRCNDFGAGGVSVAIGELADGLRIDLDAVPRKYEGLDGTELAISESQERMAVALSPGNVDAFIELAREENLEATPIAVVTEEPRVRMTWRGTTIVDISREFLASNGAPKFAAINIPELPELPVFPAFSKGFVDVEVMGGEGEDETCEGCLNDVSSNSSNSSSTFANAPTDESLQDYLCRLEGDINNASNKGLAERFDSTIGSATVLMPFGGTYQLTPAQAMVAKLPIIGGNTTTVSGLSWGFNPYLTARNPFAGSYIAVIESVAKLVATGFERTNMYLTFQEYFPKLGGDPTRWGQPAAAILGALMAQLAIGVGAIGGKDSMSGSFEDIDVPPTLISFATAVGSIDRVVSPEFKRAGSNVVWICPLSDMPVDINATFDAVSALIGTGKALSCATVGYAGLADTIFKMCVGNRLGIALDESVTAADLCMLNYATFVVELAEGEDADSVVSCLRELMASHGAHDEDSEALFDGEDTEGAFADGSLRGEDIPDDFVLDASGNGCEVLPLGTTTTDFAMKLTMGIDDAGNMVWDTADLSVVQKAWESGIENVFPYRSVEDTGEESAECGAEDPAKKSTSTAEKADTFTIPMLSYTSGPIVSFKGTPIAQPRVIIPVFPGTNCEYDTLAAFERAGARVTTQIINNMSPEAVHESADELVRNIQNAQIVMIPGGFSGGDEPDGSAKFITAFFRSPAVTEAVRDLLQNRDGLMLGICNGFQALVKLGLVPFGDIVDPAPDAPTLTFNNIGRHQSRLVNTRIASNLSPWLSKCAVGDIHTVAISHGEGRFVASPAMLDQMANAGQIATQYVDVDGVPSMDLSANPNGSVWAIEGITSPDGRILGKMGHSERTGEGLYKNVPGNLHQPIFESGVSYFL